jgi:CelD/BcsL family acetyltransferase involved in cellulose biosynthesis
MGLELITIHNAKDFYALRNEWNDLLEKSDQNTIFLRWEWLYIWWQVYGTGPNQLCIYIIKDNGRLVAIAPFYRTKKYLFFSEMRFLGSNVICSDYLNIILTKNREDALMDFLLSALDEAKSWDALELKNMLSSSSSVAAVESFFEGRGYKASLVRENTVCPYVYLNSPWENISDSFSSQIRNIVSRKSKKLEKNFTVSYFNVKSDEDIKKNLPEFLRLSRLRFNEKKMHSPFLDSKFYAFHEKIISELSKKHMVKFDFLKVNDTLMAGTYIYRYNKRDYYYQSGFDPAWSNYSPGTLLFYHSIKNAHDTGQEEYDFLQGDEDYKGKWTEHVRYCAKLRIINNKRLGGVLLQNVESLAAIIKKTVKFISSK